MKKIFISLFVIFTFSAGAFSQTVKSSKSLFNFSQNKLDDDFDDDIDFQKTLKPSIDEVREISNTDKIPANIKQDYKKEEDDSYLLEGFQIGVGAGVLSGVNAQLGYRIPRRNDSFWKNRFGFRLDYNTWKPFESTIESYLDDNPIDIDGNDFSGMISGKNYGALIDFYPFGNTWGLGNFRISGGYYSGDFSMNVFMTKTDSQVFNINGVNYEVNGEATLSAGIDADVKGPYAGVGFDFALLLGLKFYFDAGVVFIDNPKVNTGISGTGSLSVGGGTPIAVNLESNPVIQQLLEDTKKEYEDELDIITDSKVFPMIKLGLMLRF